LYLMLSHHTYSLQIITENYKALKGETVRLECPQPDPTWFFRSSDREIEDLIVTRHGIINVDYKYKITCHPVVKHQTISINKIDIEDEGIYSCLYTSTNSPKPSSENDGEIIAVQHRLNFNVSVYTLISGLSMSVKPVNGHVDNTVNAQVKGNKATGSDNVLTVKQNDELVVNCIVERSKPAAKIDFLIGEQDSKGLASLVLTSSNVLKNSDKSFKTVYTAKLKAHVDDQGKAIMCRAENGVSNQKWENRKILNILHAPICKDPKNKFIFTGVNQTANIECHVKNANPTSVSFDWHLSESVRQRQQLGDRLQFSSQAYTSSFKFTPKSVLDFGEMRCRARNDIGSTDCVYELKLGGVPNPPYDCTHSVKNSSAIIFCQMGFHQGDPDIYCFLLRKSENGVYKEHTRSRDSCSFIVNDVNSDKLNEFWVYSSNKFGHNKDNGVYLTIGELRKAKLSETTDKKTLILAAAILAVIFLIIFTCCICCKMKKGYSDDSDSFHDTDTYVRKTSAASAAKERSDKIASTNEYKNDYDDEESDGYDRKSDKLKYNLNKEFKDTYLNSRDPKSLFDEADNFYFTKRPSVGQYDSKNNRFYPFSSPSHSNKQDAVLSKPLLGHNADFNDVHKFNFNNKSETSAGSNQLLSSDNEVKSSENSKMITFAHPAAFLKNFNLTTSDSETYSKQPLFDRPKYSALFDNNNLYSTISKSAKNSPARRFQSPKRDFAAFDTGFLKELSEEVEVSLNVDCDCANNACRSDSAHCDSNGGSVASTVSTNVDVPNEVGSRQHETTNEFNGLMKTKIYSTLKGNTQNTLPKQKPLGILV